jgi:hypothetical protein
MGWVTRSGTPICFGVLGLIPALLPVNSSAQTAVTPHRSPVQSKAASAAMPLDAEPKLHMKVWLIAPDGTIERLLSELAARTTPLTHLKLQAQNSVRQIPVSCYVAGVPLRDVLDGLTALGALRWRRISETTLQLGVAGFDPQREERQNRIAYYGMRVVQQVRKQPADLGEALARSRVRLGNMPSPLQQEVQTLLRVRAELPPPDNLPLLETPANPDEMSISLNAEITSGWSGYMLRFLQARRVSGGLSVMEIGLRFSPQQANAYLPSPRIDAMSPERSEELNDDPRFAQPIALKLLNLHRATLPEALKTLFATTRLPLLAFTPQPSIRADLALAGLPLAEVLDRLCAAYDCRWVRRESGLVVLLAKQK